VNSVLTESFKAKHPEPGTDYLVNGKKMHMNCTGAGSPTVVLEAAWAGIRWFGRGSTGAVKVDAGLLV